MSSFARICAVALLAILPACSAQSPQHKKRPDPKPEPTKQELFEFIRGDLLAYTADDGISDNQEVTYDPIENILRVKQPDGHCDHFLSSLNANTLVWDVVDPSDSVRTREPVLRLTVVSLSGKTARTCFDNWDRVDTSLAPNRSRFLFSYSKAKQASDFQSKLNKAFKKLIALSGGEPEKDIF